MMITIIMEFGMDFLKGSSQFEQTIQLEHDEESERGPHSNAQFHVDTFHPILKAYFLINDTDTTNGAFRYIKSSNTLSTKQLTRTYIDSNYDYTNPSYQKRYSDEEAEQFGHIEHFSYPRNTLIFADTSGLHARGYFSTNKTRELVYIDCRYNPFLEIRNIIKQFLP